MIDTEEMLDLMKQVFYEPNIFVPVSHVDKVYMMYENTEELDHIAFYHKDEYGMYKLLGRYDISEYTIKQLRYFLSEFLPDD